MHIGFWAVGMGLMLLPALLLASLVALTVAVLTDYSSWKGVSVCWLWRGARETWCDTSVLHSQHGSVPVLVMHNAPCILTFTSRCSQQCLLSAVSVCGLCNVTYYSTLFGFVPYTGFTLSAW